MSFQHLFRFLLFGFLISGNLPAAQVSPAVITIIIDDMGNNPVVGQDALQLPGDITYSFLPKTPFAKTLAEKAVAQGKEVMLHVPMQSESGKALGPSALTMHMTEFDFKQILNRALDSLPEISGMNNHMGSLLTRHPRSMQWVMDVARKRNLFFVDSRTSKQTVAEEIATQNNISAFRRDVFLDNYRTPSAIQQQFEQLLKLAQQRGWATAIAHPYPETLAVLYKQLPLLAEKNIKLVFASEMTKLQRRKKWPESSSRLHKVAKNLKP